MSMYKSKSAKMKHEKTESKKELLMEYGVKVRPSKPKTNAKPKAKAKKK